MTHDEMLYIDGIVCRGLNKKPGEVLARAAARALRSRTSSLPMRRAASLILKPSRSWLEAWDHMRRAAEALGRRHKSQEPGEKAP
jgi:hypothetical protein